MADAARAHVWENTATYEAYMGRWSRPVAEAALAWLGLPPGLTWLDVGCGTGALTEVILEAADPREILGADPSGDFIATAAAQIADPRVRFAIGDARALPVPDDAYDVVVAGLVLHFVPDPQAAVVEMTRAARDGRHRGRLRLGLCWRGAIHPTALAGGDGARSGRGRAGPEPCSLRCATRSRSPPCLRGPACRP